MIGRLACQVSNRRLPYAGRVDCGGAEGRPVRSWTLMADMTMSAAEVAAAIDADLANLRDPRVRAGIMAFRVAPPALIRLAWDYGQPGETFGGWLVFSDPQQRTGIAYCDQGFGPKSPWGLIATGETCPSMGMDSGWFR